MNTKIQNKLSANTSLLSDTGWELSNKSKFNKIFVRTLTFPCPACRGDWEFCHNKEKAKCGNVALVELVKHNSNSFVDEQDIFGIHKNFKKMDCIHFKRFENRKQNMENLILLISFIWPFLLAFFVIGIFYLLGFSF